MANRAELVGDSAVSARDRAHAAATRSSIRTRCATRSHAEFGCHSLVPGTTARDSATASSRKRRQAGGNFCLATHYWEIDATLKQRDAHVPRLRRRSAATSVSCRPKNCSVNLRSDHVVMDIEARRHLRLLEAVEEDSRVTQRGLAAKLGIALGLTNIYLKRLVRKGYIKCVNVQSNRLSYLITPRGIAEKVRLTYEFMDYSLHLYGEVRQHLRGMLHECAASGQPDRDLRPRRSGGNRLSVAEGIPARADGDFRRGRRRRFSRHAGAADRRARRTCPTT